MNKEFAPLLMHAARDGPAHIINIGSVAGDAPAPYTSIYSSAKAALKAYGDSLRVELAPFK
jgi:1-acylglycerone phosphate reductase